MGEKAPWSRLQPRPLSVGSRQRVALEDQGGPAASLDCSGTGFRMQSLDGSSCRAEAFPLERIPDPRYCEGRHHGYQAEGDE